MDAELARQWPAALAAGDFPRVRQLLQHLETEVPDVLPWRMELTAALWFAGRPGTRFPAQDEVLRAVGRSPEADATLARVAALGTRAAVLSFDRVSVERWIAVHERIAGSGIGPAIHARLAQAWRAWMLGKADRRHMDMEQLRRDARAAGLGSCVIEARCIEALLALADGDPSAATGAARHASRMARSEAAPLDELLAGLVLGRVRRTAGAPHLATHILRALTSIASQPFLPWLAWELRMAGGPLLDDLSDVPAARAATALDRLVRGALDANRAAFDDAARDLDHWLAGWSDLMGERDDLVAAADPEDRAPASAAMANWIAGQEHMLPRGLRGIAIVPGQAEGASAIGYVVTRKGRPGRRVLAMGARLVCADGGLVVLDPSRRPQERTDAAIALLGIEGGPLDEREFFRRLYGFDYQPTLHASILTSLVHRVRRTLEGAGNLHRAEGRLWIEVPGVLVAWDPRCYGPLEDGILRELTLQGPHTAKAAAERLGVPLRTVQAALGELVADGACARARRGRAIEYAVQDTTFSEPTITRARAWREGAETG